ncbi:transcription factor bHLH113 isoform X1 [Vitis vinifera]|uniref:transcription factor bHLH113 isoform X1 n=1 Tax=Vitis vinifera TaxID=29760 RepID=UPI00053FB3C1|nr:transcription factor bHLH113 isoform X1 [Vitis vinifera]|eukprot:XP_010647961.1 PREDICTED: transcription factor bHLH113 isoform X1 [Vitis vinifera]
MADSEGFGEDHLSGGSFSQLLFSDDVVGLDIDESFAYSPSFSNEKPPKMLCFGGYQSEVGFAEPTKTPQKSGVTCSDSSSASSTNNTNINKASKSNVCNDCCMPKNFSVLPSILLEIREKASGLILFPLCLQKKRNGSGNMSVPTSSGLAKAPAGGQRNSKKTKSENPTSGGHVKVKKEKLGERITALQQLVSPFGKTDTASVLHEAMGYIRFLQDQVQVLCSPYLQTLPSSAHMSEGGENGEEKSSKDLRSRGLCLVPVECTEHVANNNGADYWSPAMANTSSKK